MWHLNIVLHTLHYNVCHMHTVVQDECSYYNSRWETTSGMRCSASMCEYYGQVFTNIQLSSVSTGIYIYIKSICTSKVLTSAFTELPEVT